VFKRTYKHTLDWMAVPMHKTTAREHSFDHRFSLLSPNVTKHNLGQPLVQEWNRRNIMNYWQDKDLWLDTVGYSRWMDCPCSAPDYWTCECSTVCVVHQLS
jgi:hypothetical protein